MGELSHGKRSQAANGSLTRRSHIATEKGERVKVRELRKLLEESGATWTVSEELDDEQELEELAGGFSLGAVPPEDPAN